MVTLIDINDNVPVFTSASQSTTIPENAEVGRIVLVASAVDADDGTNAALTYAITEGNDEGTNMFNVLRPFT